MPSEGCPRDSEQLRGPPLVAIRLLVNAVHMPPDRGTKGKILIRLVVVLPDGRKMVGSIVIRRDVGEIRREKNVVGQDDRAAAEDDHGTNRVT